MGRLLLIRHGESEGNRERVFTRHPEVPLTEQGRVQARAAAERVRHEGFAPSAIVTSPYRRALDTARIVAEALALPVATEADLRERHWGDLTGRPYGEARRGPGYDPQRYWEWRPPGRLGETLDEVRRRAGAAVDRIAARAPAADVVVVSHGGVMTALWYHVTGEWRPGRVVDNAAIVVAEHDGGRWRGARLVDVVGASLELPPRPVGYSVGADRSSGDRDGGAG